eukprot:m51a1_g13891 putative protein serine threonine kinase (914) ;mRNA; f:674949-678016
MGELGLDAITLSGIDDAASPPSSLASSSSHEVIRTPFGSFTLESKIGRGAFAQVYKAFWAETSLHVAVKKFDTGQMSREVIESVLMEVNLLGRLKHPNILRILGYHKENDNLYIMLDYAENGSLLKLRKELGSGFPEDIVCMYVEQVLRALVYLHESGVVHRDLKAANILIMHNGDVKIADFGVAAVMGDADRHYTIVGSPYWMAPEVINATGHGTPSDIWSLGCTIHELVTGEPPYFGLNPMTAMFKIVQNPAPIPTSVSPMLKDFMERCFIKDPSRRPTAADLLGHRWLDRLRALDLSGTPRMSLEMNAVRKAIAEARAASASATAPARSSLSDSASSSFDSPTPSPLAPVPIGSVARSSSSRTPTGDGSGGTSSRHRRRSSRGECESFSVRPSAGALSAYTPRRSSTLRSERKKHSSSSRLLDVCSDNSDGGGTAGDSGGEDPASAGPSLGSLGAAGTGGKEKAAHRAGRAGSDMSASLLSSSAREPLKTSRTARQGSSSPGVPEAGGVSEPDQCSPPPQRASSSRRLRESATHQHSATSITARDEELARRLGEQAAQSAGHAASASVLGTAGSASPVPGASEPAAAVRARHTRSLKAKFVADLYATPVEAPATVRAWSMLAVGSSVWVGCGDGCVVTFRAATCEQLTMFRLHRTRIYSMIVVGSRVWCSSEEGDIYSVNPRATAEIRRHTVHDSEHRMIKCMAVFESDESHARVWSCAPQLTSSEIVVLNKRAMVKARLTVRQAVNSISPGPADTGAVWLGCIGHVVVCDLATGAVRGEVPLPESARNRKVSQLLLVGDLVWAAAGRHVYVLDRDCRLTGATMTQRNDVERLCLMHNIILSGDSEGQLLCYDPLANTLVHTLLSPLMGQHGDVGALKALTASDTERDVVIWTGTPASCKLCVWRLKSAK